MEHNPVDGHVDNSLAAIFTMMLPGLGQMLKARVIPGVIWSLGVGGGYLLNGWLGLSIHVLCILDAAFGGGVGETSFLRKSFFFAGLVVLLTYIHAFVRHFFNIT